MVKDKITFLTKKNFGTELLIKNQDEDHNFRIKEMGGKIYQSSTLLTKYFVRENFIGLIKQMFNYGKYKPLV